MTTMKVMFLDESGNHALAPIDPDYPVFVLGGVIVDQDYADGPLEDCLRSFKREVLGNDDLVLHTADLARNRNGFEAMQDTDFRLRFTPIGRHALGKPSREDWFVVETKLRRRFGRYEGAGLVILPNE
jgi:hypothetical protein